MTCRCRPSCLVFHRHHPSLESAASDRCCWISADHTGHLTCPWPLVSALDTQFINILARKLATGPSSVGELRLTALEHGHRGPPGRCQAWACSSLPHCSWDAWLLMIRPHNGPGSPIPQPTSPSPTPCPSMHGTSSQCASPSHCRGWGAGCTPASRRPWRPQCRVMQPGAVGQGGWMHGTAGHGGAPGVPFYLLQCAPFMQCCCMPTCQRAAGGTCPWCHSC